MAAHSIKLLFAQVDGNRARKKVEIPQVDFAVSSFAAHQKQSC